MKRTSLFTLLSLFAASAMVPSIATAQNGRFRQIAQKVQQAHADTIEAPKSILPEIDSTYFIVRDVDEIINSLGEPDFERTPINKVLGPWIFSGYRAIPKIKPFKPEQPYAIDGLTVLTNDSTATSFDELLERAEAVEGLDSVPFVEKAIESVSEEIPSKPLDIDVLHPEIAPKWLRDALTSYRIQEDFMYSTMVTDPSTIEKAYWDLPVPPRLPEDDVSFEAYIKKLDLPDIDPEKAVLAEDDGRRIHWLHNVNTMLQFSQAYVSENW